MSECTQADQELTTPGPRPRPGSCQWWARPQWLRSFPPLSGIWPVHPCQQRTKIWAKTPMVISPTRFSFSLIAIFEFAPSHP